MARATIIREGDDLMTVCRSVDYPSDCRHASLHIESWAGRTMYLVVILSETPKRYKVLFLEDNPKGSFGAVKYVPKYAVTLIHAAQ